MLESRELSGSLQVDLQSGDSATAEYTQNYELVRRPFTITRGERRAGRRATSSRICRLAYSLGQQHRLAGTATFETGTFYGGDKRTVSFRGRGMITIPFAVEPTMSFNWIDLPGGSFLTKLVSTRTTYTMTPRMYVSALVQYNVRDHGVFHQHPLPVGIHPGQRAVRRLHRRARHVSRPADRPREPRLHREDQPADPVLSGAFVELAPACSAWLFRGRAGSALAADIRDRAY